MAILPSHRENTPDHMNASMLINWKRTILGRLASGFTEESMTML